MLALKSFDSASRFNLIRALLFFFFFEGLGFQN